MGVFSSDIDREVRLERMRPAQIDAAIAGRRAIYVPFGSIEWHGRQNAVGLDAVKAHEQLVGLARRVGGVVFPPVFFGSGGAHADYPHSFMFEAEKVRALVTDLLCHFESDGFEAAILLSGHYPNAGEFLIPARDAYAAGGGTMRVLPIIEVEAPGAAGDHAAKWETSFMMYLHPETVDMAALAGRDDDIGGPDEVINWMPDEFKDHPCYGIWGIDPRAHASADAGRAATEILITHLANWLAERVPGTHENHNV